MALVCRRRPAETAVLTLLLVAAARPAPATCYQSACDSTACGSTWAGFTQLIGPTDYPDYLETPQIPVEFLDPADGIAHRFVVSHTGKIWSWNAKSQAFHSTPFLDLTSLITTEEGEQGILAAALDPDYRTSGQLYVSYTRASENAEELGDIVLERFSRLTDETADPLSGQVLLVIPHHSRQNHNGGQLEFGADGMLYMSVGDGGNYCDEADDTPHGQDIHSLLGKLLRLDVRGVDPGATAPECDGGTGAYKIPAGNPFAGAAVDGCGEIWALGLRNPWRFSVDRSNGDIWIGDVGQSNWEEVNWIPSDYLPFDPGQAMNFGWRCREGCAASSAGKSACSIGAGECLTGFDSNTCSYPSLGSENVYHDPVLCHDNHNFKLGTEPYWQSIIGGYRYRGSAIPELAGRYVYGGAFCGQIWATTSFSPSDPTAATASCLDAGHAGLYSFAQDSAGELYALFGDGTVLCVNDGDGCPWASDASLFADGFESGDTSRWSATILPP